MKGLTECPAQMNETLQKKHSVEVLNTWERGKLLWVCEGRTYIEAVHPEKNKNHSNKGYNILIVLKLQIFEWKYISVQKNY